MHWWRSRGTARYQDLVAGAGDVTAVMSRDGLYRYVSPGASRMFGWTPKAMTGSAEDSFVHPDDVAGLRASRSRRCPERVLAQTYRLRCGDGSYRWVEATSIHGGPGGGR